MLIPLLVPHAAEQPNITNPTSIKLNQLTIAFLQCFYIRGMQHIIAAVVTNIVHSNIQSYVPSNKYVTQLQTQKYAKQTPKTSFKVWPDFK